MRGAHGDARRVYGCQSHVRACRIQLPWVKGDYFTNSMRDSILLGES